MKKQIITAMASLFLLSFLFTSCEKEGVKNEAETEIKEDLKIKVKWQTVEGEQKYPSGTGTLKIDPGTNNVKYEFIPTIPACCDAAGVKFDFLPPNGVSYIQSKKTGIVELTIHGEGTWVFTMICICNGVEHRAVVTIVVV